METLIVNSNSKKDITLLLDIAKKIGIDVKLAIKTDVKTPVTAIAKPKLSKQQEIMKLSKEVNKAMTKKLLAFHNISL
jgi:hypothetical protein